MSSRDRGKCAPTGQRCASAPALAIHKLALRLFPVRDSIGHRKFLESLVQLREVTFSGQYLGYVNFVECLPFLPCLHTICLADNLQLDLSTLRALLSKPGLRHLALHYCDLES
jgi:hypothetical protein